jgi:hypothetical protein
VSPRSLSYGQLRATVKAVRGRFPEARVIGIHSAPWSGPTTVQVGGEDVEVAYCPSGLAVRERLARYESRGQPLVLLTDCSEDDLGVDVLARLVKRRLLHVESWQALMDLFQAHDVDPRLVRERWIAETLLDAIPAEGFAPVPGGVLDADTVWRILLCDRLGFESPQPDARDILRWTLDPSRLAGFDASVPEFREGVAGWLSRSAGSVGAGIVRSILAGRGADALPVGLICRVLYGEGTEAEPALRQAAVRLEPLMQGHFLTAADGLGWADAAEAVLRGLLDAGGLKAVGPWLARADALLGELRAEGFAYRSAVLLLGFEQRLERYGAALGAALEGAGSLDELEAMAREAVAHDHASVREGRAQVVEMSLRLARRLLHEGAAAEATSFSEAASAYAINGGFVDWARGIVWPGDAAPTLGEAMGGLGRRVADMREAENRRFGQLLAEWTAVGSSSDEVIPVEELLGRVLAPLAKHAPVVLVVIDGMSYAVFRELHEDFGRHGWFEIGSEERPARLPVIAALPSITEVSRASLLCGALRRGASAVEKEGFAAHPGLLAACAASLPPILFHKVDLSEPGGGGLAPNLRKEIENPKRRVAGVVINAVDDHLAKGDQLRLRWRIDTIRPLEWILDAAREAGRAVVVTSDHGHVLERDLVYRSHDTESARFRPAGGALAPDEVMLRGPRVLLPGGGTVVAPWSERVRYTQKQNGYHGGATPQEVVIPLAVYGSGRLRVPGWMEIGGDVPGWWDPEGPIVVAPSVSVPVAPPVADRRPQGEMFPLQTEPVAGNWVEQLLASAVFQAQKRLVARMALPDERVQQCLLVLDERGGKLTRSAFARSLGMPLARMGGLIAALRRLLNVEGYSVLTLDEDSDTVTLNRALLDRQFQL